MSSAIHAPAVLRETWPLLERFEESLRGRSPVLLADPTRVGETLVTPLSLQHVGEHITEVAKAAWTDPAVLGGTVVGYLDELVSFWETVYGRHARAAEVFAAAPSSPYCLLLRSFSGVGRGIEVPGARAMLYLNDAELDANFTATLAAAGWLNPVTCLHTDDMQLLVRAGPSVPAFRVQTSNWRGVLDDAIASSGSVLLYVDGDSPGVAFELDRIRAHGQESRCVVVHRAPAPPAMTKGRSYVDVLPSKQFLDTKEGETGPGKLSDRARAVLRRLADAATTRAAPSERLRTLRCEIVDTGAPEQPDGIDPARSYFITERNAGAFVHYVQSLPESLTRWNAISQDIRLRGIQPSTEAYNALYHSVRMAFASAACLGLTASVALTLGLATKVASMAKTTKAENRERVRQCMRVLDIAKRFDALTERHEWGEKIEAYRQSILEDPFV